MGYYDKLLLEECLPADNLNLIENDEALNRTALQTKKALAQEVFGLPYDDASSLYVSKLGTEFDGRDRLQLVMICMLMEKGLTFDQIMTSGAAQAEKQELGREFMEAANGDEKAKKEMLDRCLYAVSKQFDQVIKVASDAVHNIDQRGALRYYGRYILPFFDALFDINGQVIYKTDMLEGPDGDANYRLYGLKDKDGRSIETKDQTAKRLLRNYNHALLLREYRNAAFGSMDQERQMRLEIRKQDLKDTQFVSTTMPPLYVKRLVGQAARGAGFNTPEEEDKLVSLWMLSQGTLTRDFYENILSRLPGPAQYLLFAGVTSENGGPAVNVSYKNIAEFDNELYMENPLRFMEISLTDAQGRKHILNNEDLQNNGGDLSPEIQAFLISARDFAAENMREAEERLNARRNEQKKEIPTQLTSYRNLFDADPKAMSEIMHVLEVHENRAAKSILPEKDPYELLLIGGRSAAEVFAEAMKEHPGQKLTAAGKRGLMAGIVLAALSNNIPVTSITGTAEPEQFTDIAGEVNILPPDSLYTASKNRDRLLNRIFKTIKPAFAAPENEERTEADHKKAVEQLKQDTVTAMSGRFMESRGYLKNSMTELTEKRIREVNGYADEFRTGISAMGLPNRTHVYPGYTLGGQTISRETAILALAYGYSGDKAPVLAGNEEIIPEKLTGQNSEVSKALHAAAVRLNELIEKQKTDPAAADADMRQAIVAAAAKLGTSPLRMQGGAVPAVDRIARAAGRDAAKLQAKAELLHVIGNDKARVKIGDVTAPMSGHLADKAVLTDHEAVQIEVLQLSENMNHVYSGQQIKEELQHAALHTGRFAYLLRSPLGEPKALNFAEYSEEDQKADEFAAEYKKQADPTERDASSLQNTLKNLNAALKKPAVCYEKTLQYKAYGKGSMTVGELRAQAGNRAGELQFFDHDGLPVPDDHVFKKDEVLAVTSGNGLSGCRFNSKGVLEYVPLTYSDKVLNANRKEFERIAAENVIEKKVVRRMDRLLGCNAQADRNMPHAEGMAALSEIRPGEKFREEKKAFLEDAVKVMVMGAAVDPERIKKLQRDSFASGMNTETRTYFYMTDWMVKFDRRTSGFGDSHKEARQEAAEIAANYDSDRYYELVLQAADFTASNACTKYNPADIENDAMLYAAHLTMNVIRGEGKAFEKKLCSDPRLGIRKMDALRAADALYELKNSVNMQIEKLARGSVKPEERKKMLLRAAAQRLVIEELKRERDGANSRAGEVLYLSKSAQDITVCNSGLITYQTLALQKDLALYAPEKITAKLMDEGGAEELTGLFMEQMEKSPGFARILNAPENCIAGQLAEFISGNDAKNITDDITKGLRNDRGSEKVHKQLEDLHTKDMERAHNNALKENPLVRAGHELFTAKMRPEKRSALSARELAGREEYLHDRAYQKIVEGELNRNLVVLRAAGYKKLNPLLSSAENMYREFSSQVNRSDHRIYYQADELKEITDRYLNANRAVLGRTEKGRKVLESVQQFSDYADLLKRSAQKTADAALFKEKSIKDNEFSTDMLGFYRNTAKELKSLKERFEANDPMWLPSNNLIRAFKRQLDRAVITAEEYTKMNGADLAARRKMLKTLQALNTSYENIRQSIRPTSSWGRARKGIMEAAAQAGLRRYNEYIEQFGAPGNMPADQPAEDDVNLKENERFRRGLKRREADMAAKEEKKLGADQESEDKAILHEFLNMPKDFSYEAKNSSAKVRRLFEEVSLDCPMFEKLRESGVSDYNENQMEELKTAAARAIIADTIRKERELAGKAGDAGKELHTFEQRFEKNPDDLLTYVKNQKLTEGLVKSLFSEAGAGKFLREHGPEITDSLLKGQQKAAEKAAEAKDIIAVK